MRPGVQDVLIIYSSKINSNPFNPQDHPDKQVLFGSMIGYFWKYNLEINHKCVNYLNEIVGKVVINISPLNIFQNIF